MSEDAELEEIRRRRMAELQGSQEQQEKREQMEERRKIILTRILEPEARERLSRIALVKPDNARQVEDMIIQAAQYGQLTGKVDEPKLISLLEQISERKQKTTVTVIRRKNNNWDDDD
eukprot:TRINITY_DN9706_c0_g1_i2.p1 TRINITY_DN9706_c0_g1~~TRINITY_DN9706_c0_g1_i2.p1  ORF type:complete len:118 (+),score=26.48 TRINITY_DN9706_c0_g1_i2:78-431(+)